MDFITLDVFIEEGVFFAVMNYKGSSKEEDEHSIHIKINNKLIHFISIERIDYPLDEKITFIHTRRSRIIIQHYPFNENGRLISEVKECS